MDKGNVAQICRKCQRNCKKILKIRKFFLVIPQDMGYNGMNRIRFHVNREFLLCHVSGDSIGNMES